VAITRRAGPAFYARIVLQLPGGGLGSVDSRPSDALGLALQLSAPLYVANSVLQVGWLQGLGAAARPHDLSG
jgi:bifunctional DNase/RNase